MRNERRAPREREAGFSLIEVLAALAITAALVTVVLPFSAQLVERWATGEARLQAADQWMQAHLRMSDDIAQAVPMAISGTAGPDIAFRAGAARVSFVRPGLGRSAPRNLDIVTYLIESSPSGDTLYRSASSFTREKFAAGADTAQKTKLLEGAFRLRFRIVEADSKDADGKAVRQLPLQVRLSATALGTGWVPPAAIVLQPVARTSISDLDLNSQPER